MALPSQTERTAEMSRPVMTRGSRKASANTTMYWAGAAALLLAAGALYGLYRFTWGGSGPTPAGAAQPEVKLSKAVEAKPGVPAATGGPVKPVTTPPGAKSLVAIDQGKPSVTPTSLAGNLGDAISGAKTGDGANPPPLNIEPGKPQPVDISSPDMKPKPAAGGGETSPAGPTGLTSTASTMSVRSQIESGDRAMAANKLVEARAAYSKALLNPECARGDQELLRSKLGAINDDLVFSPKVTAGDPLTETYTVAAGDALEKIRKKRDLTTEWMLIQRVNKMASPNSLQVGQKLKLVRGPFHAVVHKGEFRLDLFAGSPDDTDNWVYIRSFKVGLGDGNGTPVGTFVIRNKQKNPPWTNPRTGEKFGADDPKNPIGEYWLGWQGLGDAAVYTGFGLHGTVDPASVGQQKSMGCVRLLPDDIATVYEMLSPRVSMVKVLP